MKNFWLYLFLIILITFCLQFNNNNYENFTPFMRKMYRPHIRKARIMSENIYENYQNNVNVFLKKYNIL
jgi:uncharacterized protein YggT (Ycf19 family)